MFVEVAGCLALLVAFKVVSAWLKAFKYYRSVPGYFGTAYAGPGKLVRTHNRWNKQPLNNWLDKGKSYKDYGLTGYMVKSLWTGNSTLVLADAAAIKLAAQKSAVIDKPLEIYKAVGYYGDSLLVTPTNDEWRKHRKVAGPAFGSKFDEAMWDQTIRYIDQSIGRIEARNEPKGQRVVNIFEEVTRSTLLIIFAAGFGVDVPWPENAEAPVAPHKLTFLDASEQQFAALVPKGFMPKWFWKLPTAKIRSINAAFAEFEAYVFEMIDERRAMEAQGVIRNDLFSGLIRASDNEQGNAKLTKQELLADIHVFLLAGHETTSHALMATLMLLALYPEHQARIVQEVREAFGEDGEDHGFEKYSELKYTTATFMEGLRLFPSVNTVPKGVIKPGPITLHTVPTKAGDEPQPVPVHLTKGTYIRFDVTALCYSAEHWGEDVADFKPSRFIDTDEYKWPRDAYLPFAIGARACIGKQSAIVEATAFLARIVAKYKIEIPAGHEAEWALRPGESEIDRRERIYKPNHDITLCCTPDLRVAFTPRD